MHYNLFDDLWTELPFWIGGSNYDTLAHLADVSSTTTDHLQQAQLQQQQDFFGLYQDPCIAGIQCTMNGMYTCDTYCSFDCIITNV